MRQTRIRGGLLAATALTILATSTSASSAEADSAAEAAKDQNTSANQAGQANDKGALSTSDIIVTGSRTAEVAPITVSLTTTQPQAAVSRDYIDNAVASADFFTLIALTPEGDVQNRILTAERDYTPSQLVEAANYLNQHYAGLDFDQIRPRLAAELASLRDELTSLLQRAVAVGPRQGQGDADVAVHQPEPVVVAGDEHREIGRAHV